MTDEKKTRAPAEYLIENEEEFSSGVVYRRVLDSPPCDSKAAALRWLKKNPTAGPTRVVRVCWSGTPVVENKTVVRL